PPRRAPPPAPGARRSCRPRRRRPRWQTVRSSRPPAWRSPCSDPPASVAGCVDVREDAHLILVSVDQQLLQQRIARVLAERALQILLGTLNGRQTRHDLGARRGRQRREPRDRKSTRLNSSHVAISYAVFCL